MIFGDTKIFAIEAELNELNRIVFIKYCFWIKEKTVGDLDQSSLLTATKKVLENILSKKGMRKVKELMLFSTNDIINYLIHNLWDDSIYTDVKLQIPVEVLRNLDVNSHEGENFQGYYAFLFEENSFDFLLCKDDLTGEIISLKISKGYFYKQVRSCLSWIEESTTIVLRRKTND